MSADIDMCRIPQEDTHLLDPESVIVIWLVYAHESNMLTGDAERAEMACQAAIEKRAQ